MKVIMVMVMSLDGKITRGDDFEIYKWTSKEDQDHFFSLIKKYNLIVMGRKTYEAARDYIVHSPGKLRIVLTKSPEKQIEIPDQLEFSKEKPEKLVKRMEKRGYKQMLLVGGPTINTLFLKVGLVDEIYITIEPRIFGKGDNLVKGELLNQKLHLRSVKRLNIKGTLLIRYELLSSRAKRGDL